MREVSKRMLKVFTITFSICIGVFILIFLLSSFVYLEWIKWDWQGIRILFNICFVIALTPSIVLVFNMYDKIFKGK